MNLNQITIAVTDLQRSILFYKTLKLQLIVENDEYARFICPDGDSTFSLHLDSNLRKPNGIIIYFECENLNTTVAGLKQQGLQFTKELQDQRWLWREAYLQDPDGHSICLYYAGENRKNPPWRIR